MDTSYPYANTAIDGELIVSDFSHFNVTAAHCVYSYICQIDIITMTSSAGF
jgi:hypothetical protein